jgi:hypothetical protein
MNQIEMNVIELMSILRYIYYYMIPYSVLLYYLFNNSVFSFALLQCNTRNISANILFNKVLCNQTLKPSNPHLAHFSLQDQKKKTRYYAFTKEESQWATYVDITAFVQAAWGEDIHSEIRDT